MQGPRAPAEAQQIDGASKVSFLADLLEDRLRGCGRLLRECSSTSASWRVTNGGFRED